MDDKDKKDEAKIHARRAGRQLRHAAHNAEEAAEAAADVVKDEVTDVAEKSRNSLKDLAAKAVGTEKRRGVLSITIGIIWIGIGAKELKNAQKLKNLAENAEG